MRRKKTIRILGLIILLAVIIGGGLAYYMFNMPHRDIQSETADYSVGASEIVNEYLSDASAANQKYLSSDGNSKILKVKGTVAGISEDFNGNTLVLLKEADEPAGVQAAFTLETNSNADKLRIGKKATIKGVIRSGAAFDEDLGIYVHVVLEKSDVVEVK